MGDSALRQRSRPVREITQATRDILSQMAQIMYNSSGIGLAAPQVGINENMLVADTGSGLYKLINPRIVSRQGQEVMEEGCLSLPEICIKVRRAEKIKLIASDEFGQPLKIETEGLLARVFQHEIDHLKGKLIIDYASFFEKLKIRKKIAELKKRSKDEKLPEQNTKSCRMQL